MVRSLICSNPFQTKGTIKIRNANIIQRLKWKRIQLIGRSISDQHTLRAMYACFRYPGRLSGILLQSVRHPNCIAPCQVSLSVTSLAKSRTTTTSCCSPCSVSYCKVASTLFVFEIVLVLIANVDDFVIPNPSNAISRSPRQRDGRLF